MKGCAMTESSMAADDYPTIARREAELRAERAKVLQAASIICRACANGWESYAVPGHREVRWRECGICRNPEGTPRPETQK
jgi:hypothetical protein